MDKTAAALALFNLEAEAVLGADALGDRLVNRLVDVRKDAGFHQVGDDLERLLLELVSQFADDDGRFYGNHLRIRGQHDFRRRASRLGRLGRDGALLLGWESGPVHCCAYRSGGAATNGADVTTTYELCPSNITRPSRQFGANRSFGGSRARFGPQLYKADLVP